MNIEDTPEYKHYFEQVERDFYVMQKMPEEYKTYAMCKHAIEHDWRSANYIPEGTMDYDLRLLTIQKGGTGYLYDIPARERTFELCEAAVAVDTTLGILQYVPKKHKTYDVCTTAMHNYAYSLRYVPEDIIDHKMAILAVHVSSHNLAYLPERLKSDQVCWMALLGSHHTLAYVPESYLTHDKLMQLVVMVPEALASIPDELITEDIALEAFSRHPVALLHIPDKYKTEAMCLSALKTEPRVFRGIPEGLQTVEMCQWAVKQDRFALAWVRLPNDALLETPDQLSVWNSVFAKQQEPVAETAGDALNKSILQPLRAQLKDYKVLDLNVLDALGEFLEQAERIKIPTLKQIKGRYEKLYKAAHNESQPKRTTQSQSLDTL